MMQIHWTDQDIGSQHHHSSTVIAGENQRARQRSRHHRVRLANRILQHYGLRVDDWSGNKFILKDKKGRSEIVHDLGVLWPAAEKLKKRPLDPLDPALLKALVADGRKR